MTTQNALPDTVIIFDGDCAFCQLWVDRMGRYLPVAPPAVPSQAVDLDAVGLTADDVARFAWLITPTHHVAGGAILRELLKHQPRAGLRFVGHLLSLWPFPLLADGVYKIVARNRHRFPGSTPSCESDTTQ